MIERFPSLFIGHGSPLNAIQDNAFTQSLRGLLKSFPAMPKAVLAISAHWETDGTWVQASKSPKTIHDFGGFPDELFQVQYPAPGSPELAERVRDLLDAGAARLTEDWGLDHGTWSVLRHLFPDANVPVVQLSINHWFTPAQHFELGKKLRPLRDEGVLILGTGNIVHNLRLIQWRAPNAAAPWAERFDERMKQLLLQKNGEEILAVIEEGSDDYRLSVPTPDHFWPLLYVLGATHTDDQVSFPYEGLEMGSISMRSVLFKSP